MTWLAAAEDHAARACELAAEAAGLNASAWAAGVDAEATRPLIQAAIALDRRVSGALFAAADPSPSAAWLTGEGEELDTALALLGRAVDGTGQGAADARETAIDTAAAAAQSGDAEAAAAAQAAARRTVADCEAALEVLEAIAGAIDTARAALAALPETISETYEAAFRLAARGGMPWDGQFFTGRTAA